MQGIAASGGRARVSGARHNNGACLLYRSGGEAESTTPKSATAACCIHSYHTDAPAHTLQYATQRILRHAHPCASTHPPSARPSPPARARSSPPAPLPPAMADALPFAYDAALQLPSVALARIVQRATAPDAELRAHDVVRETQADGAVLRIRFRASSRRALRTSVLSFYDFVSVSLRALDEFDARDKVAANEKRLM